MKTKAKTKAKAKATPPVGGGPANRARATRGLRASVRLDDAETAPPGGSGGPVAAPGSRTPSPEGCLWPLTYRHGRTTTAVPSEYVASRCGGAATGGRGLCPVHYNHARRGTLAGTVTWDRLTSLGWAAPAGRSAARSRRDLDFAGGGS